MGILGVILGSLGKSKKLQKISKRLSKELTIEELMNFEDYVQKDEIALNELVDLCESDLNIRVISNNYNIGRDRLKEIYRMLNNPSTYNWDNGTWVSGHHIPSSSIAYCGTLDFILRNQEKLFNGTSDEKTYICERLYKYFSNGETGFIEN